MKFQLEGDPAEIASFLQTLPTQEAQSREPASSPEPNADMAAMVASFEREASRIVVHGHTRTLSNEYCRGKRAGLLAAAAITRGMLSGSPVIDKLFDDTDAPDEETSARPKDSPEVTPNQTVEPDYPVVLRDGRQPAIKDRITQFLERRGRAKIGDISKAVGIPTAKLSPRIAELATDGYVIRHPTDDGNAYEFSRPYISKGRGGRRMVSEKSPEAVPTPVEEINSDFVETQTLHSATTAERGGSVKEAIVNFLVGYGDASIKDIAEYYDFTDQSVRSRGAELVLDGFIERITTKEGLKGYRALRNWGGEPIEQPKVAESKPVEKTPSQKTILTDYLAEKGPVESSELAALLPETPRKTVQARLAELANDGFVVRHYDDQQRIAKWELVKPYKPHQTVRTPEPEAVIEEQAEELTPEHLEHLRIMGALADHPNSNYMELEPLTGLSRAVLSKHLLALEEQGLVERLDTVPLTFVGKPPTRKNQNPPPVNSLNEAVLAMVREKPGQTSLQMAIRMMKSWSEVARRLRDLQKTAVECRVEDGHERYYPRTA